jgi:large subunit ribosomal protein L24
VYIRRNDTIVLMKQVTGARNSEGGPVGKEAKGTTARVLKVDADKNRLLVEGVHFIYKHLRRSQQHPRGGRVAKEAPIDASNVLLYCPKCDGPTRVRRQVVEKQDVRGKRRREVLRICKRCGETIGAA